MKTLGLIGGMSWESTAIYYRLLNEIVRERLGGLHSASSSCGRSISPRSPSGSMQATGREPACPWCEAARGLEAAARRALVCTNTMHKLADEVQAAVSIPLIHIADATAVAVKDAGVSARRCWRRGSPWSRISTRAGLPTNTACSRWCRIRLGATWCIA